MSDIPEPWNLSEDELLEFRGKVVVARYDELNVTAYRKYTPGHWEKKVGDEWVWDEDSGSWSDWTLITNNNDSGTDSIITWTLLDAGSNLYAWDRTPGAGLAYGYKQNDKNAELLYFPHAFYQMDQPLIYNRNWTTNKDKDGNPV